ncbi:hypothetical protein BCR35DRAFT_98671 [Leucosporidium creatinivorum]|uniref:Uncharacterized protein n=1 Tax=Leucosporidium creatinivorum TaxID=106004 RepID=A0A1Y2F584_9BASI|nr:hypothetical protein BCR35DRAFT_98671 [Leucosporidium creatinivorum]
MVDSNGRGGARSICHSVTPLLASHTNLAIPPPLLPTSLTRHDLSKIPLTPPSPTFPRLPSLPSTLLNSQLSPIRPPLPNPTRSFFVERLGRQGSRSSSKDRRRARFSTRLTTPRKSHPFPHRLAHLPLPHH